VNLTLDHGDMSEATLSTGMFTVTRSVDENFDQPLQVRFVFAGSDLLPSRPMRHPCHRLLRRSRTTLLKVLIL
jgi:hypothetical protein